MSRGEESDEEVYLSDPSDDEDSKSVDNFENANDHQGGQGYEQAMPSAAIDTTLHDAEAARAAAAPGSPKPTAEARKTVLSPKATPWVPKSLAPAAKEEPAASPAAPKPAASATPAVHKQNEDEEIGSPVDVKGIFARAAAADTAAAASKPVGSNGKEPLLQPTRAAAATNTAAAAAGPETPAASETATAAKPAEEEPQLFTKPVSSLPSLPPKPALEKPEHSEAPGQKEVAPDAAPVLAKSLPGENEDKHGLSAETAAPAPAVAQRQVEAPKVDAKPAEEEPAAPAESSATAETAKKPAGMPSLPERRRPSTAMPSLPARPPRRPAASPASQEQEAQEEAPAAPKPAAAATEAHQSQPAEHEPEANGHDERPQSGAQVPSNGQRGPALPARPVQSPAPAAAAPSQVVPAAQGQRPEEPEKVQKVREQLRQLRVGLLRYAGRLGMSNHSLTEHVKYRLGLAERIRLGRNDGNDTAPDEAKQKEEAAPEEEVLDATVLVIGTAGSGKSATINSLLGREAVTVDPFQGTSGVSEAVGTLKGLRLRLIDTPGLQPAAESAGYNSRVLRQIDAARRKYKPDLVMYCERMDVLRRDFSDVPVIRQLTETLGSEVWFNTVLVLTHAANPGPLTPQGTHLPFETLSQTRAAMLQRAVQAAVGDGRVSAPAAFAENGRDCPRDEAGEPVLPNGQAWRKFVLLWIAAMRSLREADQLMEVIRGGDSGGGANNEQQRLLQQLFQQRGQKMPPLQYLLPNMIKHAGPKLYPDPEREIKRPDEIRGIKDDNERWLEARRRTEYLKGRMADRRVMALPANQEQDVDPREEPSPGPALAPTFDSDDNSHLYRAFETRPGEPGWLTRARLEQNCLDHTDGVDSLTTERSFVIRPKHQDLGGLPGGMHAIIQKDKNSTLIQAEAEASFYQKYNLVHTGRAQFLTLSGGDILYVSQLETQLAVPSSNRMILGAMLSRLGEDGAPPTKGPVAMGLKFEEEIDLPEIPKYNCKHELKAGIGRAHVKLPGGRKEMATAYNAEYQLTGGARENVQVVGSLSQMEYRGNKGKQYALSAAIPITKETTLAPKIQMQPGGQGALYLRVTSHDYPMLGWTVFVPLGKALWDKLRRKEVA